MAGNAKKMRPGGTAQLCLAACLVLAIAGCGADTEKGGRAGGRGKRQVKFPVEVRSVQSYPAEYSIASVGSVDAFERVEVVARVAGILDKVSFAEGDRVTTSQVLAEVDPERYRLALAAAKATLHKSEAALAEASAALERRRKLARKDPGALTEEELASAAAKKSILQAEVAQSRAAWNLAELDVRESCVRSPVDGIIQTRTVQTGQYVTRGATLTTLLRRDPLLVRFTVPSTDAPRVRTGMTVRFTVGGFDRPFSGLISHVAAQADPASRMVQVTARVNDPERDALRPGSFAQVTVPVDTGAEYPIVMRSAVRPSERGFLAYVVKDETAAEKIVTLGMRTADGQVEVLSGLSPGDLLVVRGAEALTDGCQIQLVSAESAPGTEPATSEKTGEGGSEKRSGRERRKTER
jgi:RND family efflux transporter MFP subunit